MGASSLGSTIVTMSGKGFVGPTRPSGSHANMLNIMMRKFQRIYGKDRDMIYAHLDLDAQYTLAKIDVAYGLVDVVAGRLTGTFNDTSSHV